MSHLTKSQVIYFVPKEESFVVTQQDLAGKNLPVPIMLNNYYLTEINLLMFYGQI